MTAAQQAVLDAIKTFGPINDAALVPLVQHVSQVHMSSSGIRSRRAELVDAGNVREHSKVVMPSGRKASLWVA